MKWIFEATTQTGDAQSTRRRKRIKTKRTRIKIQVKCVRLTRPLYLYNTIAVFAYNFRLIPNNGTHK
jgi:hypothetical protein